jgi:Ni/Co efflux regulator RcnB
MRNLLLTLLLAGTAISPALAERPGRHDDDGSRDRQVERSQSREERAQAREDRSQAREERSQERQQVRGERVERVQQVQQADRHPDFSRHDASPESAQVPADVQARRAEIRERIRERSGDAEAAQANVNERGRPVLRRNRDGGDSVADWRQRDPRDVAQPQVDRRERRDVAQPQVDQRRLRDRVRVPVGARPDRPAPLPQNVQGRRGHDGHWRTDWRHDRRYDWRSHRRHHRSTFHLGFYFDPFGWGYHRYGVGWRMWPSYYSSNYWLNDPSIYSLPYAPYPYRWVRYYNDALLIDTYSGQVVDVIYDFFW